MRRVVRRVLAVRLAQSHHYFVFSCALKNIEELVSTREWAIWSCEHQRNNQRQKITYRSVLSSSSIIDGRWGPFGRASGDPWDPSRAGARSFVGLYGLRLALKDGHRVSSLLDGAARCRRCCTAFRFGRKASKLFEQCLTHRLSLEKRGRG